MVAAQDGSEKSLGIISGVFNFVTREIGSFVTAAAGGSASSIHHNESSTTQRSRSKLQRKQRAHDEPYNVRRRKEKPRLDKTSGECRPQGNTASRRRQEPISPEPRELPSLQFRSKQSPRNIPERLTMPGSLFPRSPSLMPGGVEATHAQQPIFKVPLPPRQIASASSKSSPRQRRKSPPLADGAQPLEDNTPNNPFRSPSVPSVKVAVSRFQTDDADPSLLLPSPHHSPHRIRTARSTPISSPPKSESDVDGPDGNGTPRIPYAAKGKGRAYDIREISPPMQLDELHVRSKEEELLAAREKQRRNESRREEREMTHPPDPDLEAERRRDKEQIKYLEAEIMRLKEELSKRADGTGQAYNHSAPPPPPPPPPPPSTTALRIPVHPGIHDPEVLFASARAALKPAGTPVEAQINPVVFGGKRKGQPTVGVPPEKMAAFLSEMKTVKLRRVHTDSSHLSGSTSSAAARLNMSFDSATLGSRSNLPALRLSSSVTSGPLRPPPGLAWKVGEKRKRDPRSELKDILRASKRRSMGIPTEDAIDNEEHHPTVRNNSASMTRSWPSVSTEPELTTATPSLCSDGRDDEDTAATSPDDQPPSTPPMNHNTSTTPAGDPYNHPSIPHSPLPIASAGQQDLDLELEWDDYRAKTPPLNPSQRAFSKRPPMSPLPQPTPRRPMPPKLKRSSRVVSRADDDVQPRIDPPSTYHEYDPDGDISRSLEAELRKVKSRSQLSLDDQDDDDPELVLESGVYVGIGTRSKRKGFMARGGAGGPPVLMGEGYVEGVELSDEEEYSSRPIRRTSSRSRPQSRQGYSAIPVPTQRKI